jgi:hypothetical protein
LPRDALVRICVSLRMRRKAAGLAPKMSAFRDPGAGSVKPITASGARIAYR